MKGFKEREREQDHFSVHSKKAAETIEKTRRTGARVLILLGILLCAFYLVYAGIYVFGAHGLPEADAVVEEQIFGGMFTPGNTIVSYTYSGNTYNVSLTGALEGDNAGDTVRIVYDPENPSYAIRVYGALMDVISIPGCGVLLLAAGIILERTGKSEKSERSKKSKKE